jgi:hypothetical protein
MSLCYRNNGDIRNALLRYNELFSIELTIHGEFHEFTSKTLHLQGIIHAELEEYGKSLGCFQKSLHTLRVVGISSNEAVIKTLCWIGKVQRETGDFPKALDSF